jgi:hypothetical protein
VSHPLGQPKRPEDELWQRPARPDPVWREQLLWGGRGAAAHRRRRRAGRGAHGALDAGAAVVWWLRRLCVWGDEQRDALLENRECMYPLSHL